MILIVDDYRDGAEALRRLFRAMGHRAETALSGPDAIDFIRAHPPHEPLLVVLDHMMPEMTGLQVLHILRRDPALSDTKVLFYSAGYDADVREEAMRLGALEWLCKGGGGGEVQRILEVVDDWYTRIGSSSAIIPPASQSFGGYC